MTTLRFIVKKGKNKDYFYIVVGNSTGTIKLSSTWNI